jgi:ABC-type transport system substrate-binding protein
MVDPLLNGSNIAPTGNTNTPQVNNPAINKQLAAASKLSDASARARAYAKIDRLATANAYYDDWIWDNQVDMWSSNVNYVYNKFNTRTDLVFSSLK